jgi:hypothetical protein
MGARYSIETSDFELDFKRVVDLINNKKDDVLEFNANLDNYIPIFTFYMKKKKITNRFCRT